MSTKQNLQNNKLELRIRENGVLYIFKNKGSLLALMVPHRTFNDHSTTGNTLQ